MELTRVQTSGTLWYTKKYLVLYYYVFLSKEIQTNEYVENVIKAFDIYIDSMDEKIKTKAKEFFYPDDECWQINRLKNKNPFLHLCVCENQ